MARGIRYGAGAALALVLLCGLPSSAEAQRCGSDLRTGVGSRAVVGLPQGELFCPLVADPKEPHSFASYLRGSFSTVADPAAGGRTDIAAVGLGDSFGLVRWNGARAGDGAQLGVVGAIFAQFNLDTPSFDLINADYVVGLPLTLRRRALSARVGLYHQSSHLGDEFILDNAPDRVNVSFEALEAVISGDVGPVRLYAGGERLLRREPQELEPMVAHAGVELRSRQVRAVGLVAALDVKSSEERKWTPAWSARAGVEIARAPLPGQPPRPVRLLGEFYNGPAPYGQFYRSGIRYFGVGLHVGL